MLAMIYGAQSGPLKLLQENGQFVLEDKDGNKEICAETTLNAIVLRLRGDVLPYRAITIVPEES